VCVCVCVCAEHHLAHDSEQVALLPAGCWLGIGGELCWADIGVCVCVCECVYVAMHLKVVTCGLE
jgi:hypothetical protein